MLEIYKYEEYYYIDFTSEPTSDGEVIDYRVKLFKRVPFSATPPTPIELDGAPSPFILSLSNEDDPLLAFRSTTARISFIDDIDLADLELKSPRDWQVKLYRLSDGKQVFVGYLTTEVYTQPAIEGPNTLTLNAASPMVVASATPMAIQGKGLLTIGELLKLAIDSSRLIDTVYIPAIYATEQNATAANYAEVLRWAFSPSQYIKVSDTALIDGAEYEYSPYSDALSAICKLFGWSMVDVGDGALYFISPGYQGKYMRLTAEQLTATESFTPELVTPTISDEALLQPIDTADVVEVRQGVGTMVVSVDVAKNAALMPSPDQYITKQNFTRKSTNVAKLTGVGSTGAGTGFSDGYGAEVASVNIVLKQSRIKLPRFKIVDNGDDYTLVEDPDALDAGAFYRKMDWVSFDALSPDADNPKLEWSFTSLFQLKDIVPIRRPAGANTPYYWAQLREDVPLIKIYSAGGLYLSGAFCIDFNLMATPVEGFYIPTDGALAGGSLPLPLYDPLCVPPELYKLDVYWWAGRKIKALLRVGDKYWDGVEWQSEPSTFKIPVKDSEDEWHPIATNKTIDMPYPGSSGWYIPVSQALSGEVEFWIYANGDNRQPQAYSAYPSIGYMKGLSLQYLSEIEMREELSTDTTYYRDFNSGFSQRGEVSVKLHSRINGAEQTSLIVKANQQPIDTLYRTTSLEADKPERFLLDEYQRLFGRALQRWRRGIELRGLRPLDLFSRAGYSENALALTGYTMDFESNTAEAYLSDVELPKIRRYVE